MGSGVQMLSGRWGGKQWVPASVPEAEWCWRHMRKCPLSWLQGPSLRSLLHHDRGEKYLVYFITICWIWSALPCQSQLVDTETNDWKYKTQPPKGQQQAATSVASPSRQNPARHSRLDRPSPSNRVTSANAFSILMRFQLENNLIRNLERSEQQSRNTGLPDILSLSLTLLHSLWQTHCILKKRWAFFFSCSEDASRRGINLLFAAVNQISMDRFKVNCIRELIPVGKSSTCARAFSKWYPHQWHTACPPLSSPISFHHCSCSSEISSMFFSSSIGRLAKDLELIPLSALLIPLWQESATTTNSSNGFHMTIEECYYC